MSREPVKFERVDLWGGWERRSGGEEVGGSGYLRNVFSPDTYVRATRNRSWKVGIQWEMTKIAARKGSDGSKPTATAEDRLCKPKIIERTRV